MTDPAPVIVDIVGSRGLDDRRAAQDAIRQTFSQVDRHLSPARPLWATVGDEFQVVYDDLADAVSATALVRLLSAGRFDCRFGIGLGPIRTLEQGEVGPIDDGDGWYRARRAIDSVERLQSRGHPWLRTWAVLGDDDPRAALVQSHLTTREHIITRLKAKESRITAASLTGTTQVDIARSEKMSQSAVSQRLNTSGGAALLHAERILRSELR